MTGIFSLLCLCGEIIGRCVGAKRLAKGNQLWYDGVAGGVQRQGSRGCTSWAGLEAIASRSLQRTLISLAVVLYFLHLNILKSILVLYTYIVLKNIGIMNPSATANQQIVVKSNIWKSKKKKCNICK